MKVTQIMKIRNRIENRVAKIEKKKEIEKLMNVKNVKCKMKWILRIWRTLQKMFWTKSLWKACEFTLWVLKRWRWRCIKMSKTVFVERSGNIGKRHEDMFLTHFFNVFNISIISTYLPIYLYLPLVTFNVAVRATRQDVVSRSMGFRRIQRLGDRSNRSQGRSEWNRKSKTKIPYIFWHIFILESVYVQKVVYIVLF